jgi:cytochrome c oxidase cbb3-type subunit I/II
MFHLLPGYFVTVAVLHIFNSLELPVSWFSMKSYSVYAGVQDALVQWWYGHNAVAFFLQHLLGLMYYSFQSGKSSCVLFHRFIVHFCP